MGAVPYCFCFGYPWYTLCKMKIRKTSIPETALVNRYLPANYKDAFECDFTSEQKITADEFMITFWTQSPPWLNKLLALRDWLVKPFGIQPVKERSKEKFKAAIESGKPYDFVHITDKSANEIIISADDKHLKMYFSIQIDDVEGNQKRLTASTIVRFHNWLGYAYFYLIYPFHHLVVRGMLKFTVKTMLSISPG